MITIAWSGFWLALAAPQGVKLGFERLDYMIENIDGYNQ